ncbi:hypothetical protein C3766_02195 [Heyndrickxia coagulans]|nr:hypothetical protein C3766_02195 [Heyndrickxia coagulans]
MHAPRHFPNAFHGKTPKDDRPDTFTGRKCSRNALSPGTDSIFLIVIDFDAKNLSSFYIAAGTEGSPWADSSVWFISFYGRKKFYTSLAG